MGEWHGIGWRQGFILGSGIAWQIATFFGTEGQPRMLFVAVCMCVASWSAARWVERKERKKERANEGA